jgi:hypothetical protein
MILNPPGLAPEDHGGAQMQFRMRALLVTLLLGLAGAASFMLSTASADMIKRSPFFEREMRTRAAKLRVSAGTDPETVWVGHVNTVQAGVPGTPGGYGPYHIGRGPNRPLGGLSGTADAFNGIWDFDHFQAGETDSLMGWWPIQCPFGSIGPTDKDDNLRPWFCFDYGNQGNYVIPQGSPKRTFGVLGYWHADGGSAQAPVAGATDANPAALTWAPLSGTKSAWCGLRSHNDVAVVDPITGNAFNSAVLQYWGTNSSLQFSSARTVGTDNNFPGYGSQWDQMLYRDVSFAANATGAVSISFKYTTNMDTRQDGTHASQAGWFDKDPLKDATAGIATGDFRSANVSDVVDSFMVYVGAPVDEANTLFSDGSVAPVYDLQHRWFSEVVKINTPGTTYKELLSVAGINGTPALPITVNTSLTQTQANNILDADGGSGNGGRIRIVFRVKTNRGFDDENNGNCGFTSGTAGAAIIDDVSMSGGGATALTNGFESAGDVNNSTGVPATAAWKSTGKPPAAWFHVHRVNEPGSPLPFDDPCGAITAAVRLCNMGNAVLSPGNHDAADKPGGLFPSNNQDQQKYIVSPTINLKSTGVGDYNGMGIDAEIASRVPMISGDQLLNLYQYPVTGNGFRFGWQSYPSTQPNGVRTWGQMKKDGFFNFVTTGGCLEGIIGLPLDIQLVATSNSNGIPDSIRVYIESMSRCFATSLTGAQCSPSTGALAGGYYDNLTIGFAGAEPPPQLSVVFGYSFNDCFPVNSQLKPVNAFGLAYDTLAARIQAGYNIAPQTGSTTISGGSARENIAGDSAIVGATDLANGTRVDMIFRILPGVGNYVQIGNRLSGVARRPDVAVRVAATAADAGNGALTATEKFWGAYLANDGTYGTPYPGNTHVMPGGVWDPNGWCSARMDTVEKNFFPITGVFANGTTSQLTPAFYMTMYHESDPKYTILGIAKNRCFFNGVKGNKVNNVTITCSSVPSGPINQHPDYTVPSSGFDPNEIAGQTGKTFEYTKILPDGQLTPGAMVQYFYRKSDVTNSTAFEMAPDTNFIFPQAADNGGEFDLHRWRQVSVLPDRWKDPAFGQPGASGMACMLVLDWGDRRGDEPVWVAVCDSIGMTTASKRGAHNGWHARPDQNIFGVNVGGDDSICRRDNGGQPGTLWDLYETIAGESNIPSGRPGSRGANHNNGGGSLTIGKWSTHGPSEDMVKNYRLVYAMMSDIGDETIGPIPDQTDADIPLLQSFLTLPGGSAQPRGLIASGYRFGDGMTTVYGGFDHHVELASFFRATLRNTDYRLNLSGNSKNEADLIVQPPVTSGVNPFTLGFNNLCLLNNDTYTPQVAAPSGQTGAFYENVGSNGPYVGAVYAPDAGGTRPFKTLLMGWTPGFFGGMGTQNTLLNVGTRKFWFDALTTAFNNIACTPVGNPVGIGDGQGTGSAFVNFMNLKSSNPMRSGEARIAFGLAKTEKVQVRVYDVTGRLVKMVADRTFQGGTENVVIWDGTNEVGQKAKSGVYFYQLRTPTWTSQKKLAVLAN